MPLLRHTKLPPPPELGEKSVWQYLPRGSARRVVLLLLALGAVLLLKRSGGWSLGGLLDGPARPAASEPAPSTAPVYHIRVTGPAEATPPKSAP